MMKRNQKYKYLVVSFFYQKSNIIKNPMNKKKINNDANENKKELLETLEKYDKSYSRNLIMEIIFFMALLIFLLIFIFSQ